MSDEWTVAEATFEVIDEMLGELNDDGFFFDRVLEFAEVEYSTEVLLEIRKTLAQVIEAASNYA